MTDTSIIDSIRERIADGEITLEQAADETGWEILHRKFGPVLVEPGVYAGNVDEPEDATLWHTTSREEAAKAFVAARGYRPGATIMVDTWRYCLTESGKGLFSEIQTQFVRI
jgi:hypothetical protein